MQEEEWKDFSEYRAITHRLINTNKLHFRVLEKNLEGLGIHRASHRVLMTLACHQFASQAELAKRLEVTPASIAVTLKNLEKTGYITKTAKKEDNRINVVELTKKGRKLVDESQDFFDSLDREMYQGFSEKERRELCRFLDRIYENIQQMEKKTGGQQ